jgi:hypothetical protein
VIQPTLLAAVQEQLDWVVTVTVPEDPAGGAVAFDPESEYVHGAPACVSGIDWPPIVIDVLRAVVNGFADTE